MTALIRSVSLVSITALFYSLIYKRHNISSQWLFVILSALIMLASAKAMHKLFCLDQVILSTSILVWLSPKQQQPMDN